MEEENINLEKYLATATLADIKAMIVQAVKEVTLTAVAENEENRRNFVYGLKGLASLLGCSISTAERLRQSGILDQAIIAHKGLLVIDADMVLDLLRAAGKHTLVNKVKRNSTNKRK